MEGALQACDFFRSQANIHATDTKLEFAERGERELQPQPAPQYFTSAKQRGSSLRRAITCVPCFGSARQLRIPYLPVCVQQPHLISAFTHHPKLIKSTDLNWEIALRRSIIVASPTGLLHRPNSESDNPVSANNISSSAADDMSYADMAAKGPKQTDEEVSHALPPTCATSSTQTLIRA